MAQQQLVGARALDKVFLIEQGDPRAAITLAERAREPRAKVGIGTGS